MSAAPTIIYTQTDEAPALATYSLLPIVEAFVGAAGSMLSRSTFFPPNSP